jgi:hypothetical protein
MIVKLDTNKLADSLAFTLAYKSVDGRVKPVFLVNYLCNMHRKLNRRELIERICADGIDENTVNF